MADFYRSKIYNGGTAQRFVRVMVEMEDER